MERITLAAPGATLVPHLADLGQLDDVRELADTLLSDLDRLDILAHVAGALVHDEQLTPHGLESTAPGGDFWLDRRRRHTVALPWTRTPDGEVNELWNVVSDAAGVESGD